MAFRCRLLHALGAVLVLGVAACGSDGGDARSPGTPSDDSATPRGGEVTGEVVVFAAASLTEPFIELGESFEAEHGETTVTFNFAASSALVRQITEGAPADVYASADQANMDQLVAAGAAGLEPRVFVENALALVVAPGNPEGLAGLADLAGPDVLWLTCAPEVPIGRYSADALRRAGVTATPASYEENVKAVVAKVALGEADAGIVYATDVAAAGSAVEGVRIPNEHNVVATYPITTVEDGPNPLGAEAFVDHVLSAQGQDVLASFGFSIP